MGYFVNALSMTLATVSAPAFADLLQCVDPDIAAVFLHTGYSPPPVITREMPEDFPQFDPPRAFEFVGSSTQSTTTRIAYKTDLPVLRAEDQMVGALEASGFKRQPRRQRPSQGFQTRKNLPLVLSMCADDDTPPVHVSTRRDPNTTYVTVTKTEYRPGQMMCGDLRGSLYQSTGRFMPDLKLPPDSSHANSSGSGGSNDYASTHVRFRTNKDPNRLVSFFNAQIENQDWSLVGDWAGSVGVGSIWAAEREGYRLSANLQIVGHAAKEYTAVFTIWQFQAVTAGR